MPKRASSVAKGRKAKRHRTSGVLALSNFGPGRGLKVPASTIPRSMKRKLVYVARFSRDPGAGTAASYFFSCNGLYDPDITGVGHQPMGFDQLMAFYDHYVVTGAKLTLTAMSQSTSFPAANQIITLKIRDSTTGAPSDIAVPIEQGDCTYGVIGSGNGGSSQLTLQSAVNPARFLGRRQALSDPNLKGSATANPGEECFFQITVAALASSDDPPPIDFLVKIEYTAHFIEPKNLIQS